MKATGAEITQFWQEWPLGPNWYVEESEIEVEGSEGAMLLDPGTKYDLAQFGVFCWQGTTPPAGGVPDPISFQSEFKAWRKKRTTARVVVEVPTDQLAELKAWAKAHRGKVLS